MDEKPIVHATLIFPIKDDKVLLAKKTKKIGVGCWNGYGGLVEDEETPEEAAVRELEEESSLVVSPEDLDKVALVDFHNNKKEKPYICRAHVYLARTWAGEPQESDEMLSPTWFHSLQIPLEEMMAADRQWIPPVLDGKRIKATAHYGESQRELLGPVAIEETSNL